MQNRHDAAVIPTVNVPSCVTAIRSLGRRGIPVIAATDDDTVPGCVSTYCTESVRIPSPEEDFAGYCDGLLSLASRQDVRTIMPMSEPGVYALATRYEQFSEHLIPLWPTLEMLRTAHDRCLLIEAAKNAGVAVPQTLRLGAVEDWNRDQIVKSRYGLLGSEYDPSWNANSVRQPRTVVRLPAGERPDNEQLAADLDHEPIVQEYVPGPEFSLWALYDHGEPVATCQKRQLRAWSYSGGTSIARETTDIPALEAAGRNLLDELDWHGLAAVQFIRDETTGEFVLLELNPRTWISLSCTVRAGVDIPYYYWQRAGDEPVDATTDYAAGVETHLPQAELLYLRSLFGEDIPLAEKPTAGSAVRAVGSSFSKPAGTDFFSWDDPRPYFRSLTNGVNKVFSPRR